MSGLRVSKAPNKGGEPYVLPLDEGETWAIVGCKSIMRFLTTGETTENEFAVMQTRGAPSRPVLPHWHKEAHDVFLCTKGLMQVWAGDKSRILRPGDLASIPPGIRHSFHILQANTEFLGLVIPGNWINFFKEIGEPYDGPLYPSSDDRPFPVAKYRAAIEEKGHDVIPDPSYKLFAPNPDSHNPDDKLPKDRSFYFLKADMGPRYALGNQVCSPLVTHTQSGGRFSICSIEGGRVSRDATIHQDPLRLVFDKMDLLIRVADGIFELSLDSERKEVLSAGESAFIPRGSTFSYRFPGKYGKVYVFGGLNEGGLEEIFQEAGTQIQGVLELYTPFEKDKLEDAARKIGARLF